MVLLGLLVLAAVFLTLGLIFASVAWLIGSLVASVLAAVVLYRSWSTIKERRAQMARRSKAEKAAATNGSVPPSVPSRRPATTPDEVRVVDGRPDYHRAGCARLAGLPDEAIPLSQALEDGFTPCPACAPPPESAAAGGPAARQVWVVDGSPEFHEAQCATLVGRPGEPIPLSQALEDGFVRCEVCSPATTELRKLAGLDESGAAAGTVWVADGFPAYHVQGCGELAGLDAEPIPHAQAVEDGFAPCTVCTPDALPVGATTASEPVAAAAVPARDVWVADGYPDYHRAGCRELIGLDSEPVPHEQAVEDGFAPCAVCQPEAVEVPVLAPEPPLAAEEDDLVPGLTRTDEFAPSEAEDRARAREVWVVDGYPDFHRGGCAELAGLDAVAIPFDQAVDDDFQPCRVCQPQLAAAPEPAAPVAAARPEPVAVAEPEPADNAQRVWVVDGRPRYHTQDCLIIKGQQAQAIPVEQAAEDGFKPCSLCQRDR